MAQCVGCEKERESVCMCLTVRLVTGADSMKLTAVHVAVQYMYSSVCLSGNKRYNSSALKPSSLKFFLLPAESETG